ncbi:MAG: DUF2892 domain-containing protein [Planctomycetes bacterium]|nr:DUF2892 domain-containing protein [Planctomycetota bacterium]
MKRELIIRAMAGTLVLVSMLLAANLNLAFMWIAAFVGANLLQSAFTNFCPAEKLMIKFGVGKD